MKKKNIAWGLFFVFLAAVYLVTSSTGIEIGVGLPGIFMTIMFVWLFVDGIREVDFYSMTFAIAFICIIYRKPLGLERLNLTNWTILGAALLLSIGLSMIFKDVRRKKNSWEKTINWDEKAGASDSEQCSGEHIRCENNFGSAIRYINSDHFCDARLENNFGSMSVYFDNAMIAGDAASIEVENNFGETNLYIPKEWKVQNELRHSFGAVEAIGHSEGSSVAALYLRGAANFGVIKIHYI